MITTATIRDIFNQVEEISQHGLDELFDDDVKEGKRSYAEAIIAAGLVSKEDLLNLVSLNFWNMNYKLGKLSHIDTRSFAGNIF